MTIEALNHARGILKQIQTNGNPEAIIAGGFLRDIDNKVPFKDVDIFMSGWGRTAEQVRELLGLSNDDLVAKEAPEYDGHPVSEVIDFKSLGIDFQIIICAGPQDPKEFVDFQLGRFDLGICKISYDGNTIIKHAYYVDDKAKKLLAIRQPFNLEVSIKRAKRLKEKYPDFTIVHVIED